jgi:peptidoglycan/xylan/chitin deacetylase (PgdA/CDA1 family)
MITKDKFLKDLLANYDELRRNGADLRGTKYFLAPYEWYNKAISSWTSDLGARLINLTPGTVTNADYTTPDLSNYQSSGRLIEKLKDFESSQPEGLNGAFVLIHLGTDPKRTDKLYDKLGALIDFLFSKGYGFKRL